MTVPANFVPTNNQSINLRTGIVTEAETGITMTVAEYAQAMVDAKQAHNINEARVKMGLGQDTSLPAAPDGAGNPTFAVPAPPVAPASVAPAILPIPAASAPVEHHASFWASVLGFVGHAAVVTGQSLTNPAVIAAIGTFVPAKYQPDVAIAEGIAEAAHGSNASPASIGLT